MRASRQWRPSPLRTAVVVAPAAFSHAIRALSAQVTSHHVMNIRPVQMRCCTEWETGRDAYTNLHFISPLFFFLTLSLLRQTASHDDCRPLKGRARTACWCPCASLLRFFWVVTLIRVERLPTTSLKHKRKGISCPSWVKVCASMLWCLSVCATWKRQRNKKPKRENAPLSSGGCVVPNSRPRLTLDLIPQILFYGACLFNYLCAPCYYS